MPERHESKIYGAWFFNSKGIPLKKEDSLPVRGWKFIKLIPGEYKSPLDPDLKSKVDAVLELNPDCDTLVLFHGGEGDAFDLRKYKQEVWPHIKFPEENI